MTNTLHIGKAGRARFELPRDAVTQKLAFLGRTGTGKSYAAMKAAEEMHRAGAQIVAIDVVGIWWGLRLAKDGVSPGLEIPVLGGLRGDIALTPNAGALIADLIVDSGASAILDISQFESDADKARFAAAFADRFFRRMKSAPAPVHLFLEECQELVPQHLQRGEERMLHYWTRLAKLGRNFGIGVSLISQRPQEVNKKVLNMTECLFAFQMTGTHERNAVKDWLGSKGEDATQILQLLRALPVGTAHVSSPQWLDFEGIVQVGQRRTFDSSSTPSFDDTDRVETGELAHIDLEQLQAAMEATIAEAEANDPKVLRRQVLDLTAELAAERSREGTEVDPEEIAAEIRDAVDHEVAAAVKHVREQYAPLVLKLRSDISSLGGSIENALDAVEGSFERLQELQEDDDLSFQAMDAAERPVRVPQPRAAPAPVPAAPRRDGPTAEGLSPPQQRMLDALASFEALGVRDMGRGAVAVMSSQSPKSSAFDKHLRVLKNGLGMIVYPQSGHVALTDAGRAVANAPTIPTTLASLHGAWLSKLLAPQGRMITALVEIYPGGMSREDLAETTGQSPKSSAFDKHIRTLRSFGIAWYPEQGHVAATELLFPAGLR